MNYKIALAAAFVAAVGLTGCDSRDAGRDSVVDRSTGDITSGTTSPGVGTAGVRPVNNNTAGVGTQEGDYRNVNADREEGMIDRKVNPDHAGDRAHEARAKTATRPAAPASGSTSEDLDSDDRVLPVDESDDLATNDDVYHSNDDIADDDALSDDDVVSGSTSEAGDSAKVSYEKTAHPGGIAPEDRNLRFGLIGNGTGMGLEDTTSKNMTDNYTLSDPKIDQQSIVNTGALSAPTDDQDALKDIKSGTTFEYPED